MTAPAINRSAGDLLEGLAVEELRQLLAAKDREIESLKSRISELESEVAQEVGNADYFEARLDELRDGRGWN